MGNWNASYLVIAEGNKKDIDSFEKYFYSGKALLTFIREDVCKPYFGMRSTCHRINDHKIYVAVEDDDSTGPGFWQTHSDIEHLAKTFPGLKLKNIFVVEMNGKDNYMHSEIGFESFLEGKPDKSLTIPIGAIDWECEYFTNILYEELHRKMLFAINFPREKLTPAQKKFLAYLDEINDKRGNISTSNVFKFHSLISRKNFFKLESSYYETILNRLINTSVFDDLFAEAKKEESGLPDSAYRYYSLKWLTKEFIIKKRLDRYFAIAEDFVKQNRNLLIKNYFDYSSTWYLLPHHDDDGKHFGQLSKGTVLQDTSAFKKQKDEPVKSLIKIIRLDDLCNELSNPWVYPVKIEDNTRVEKADECSWYTEKAVLLEPFNIWEVIAKLGGFSEGTINLNTQTVLPFGLAFPLTVTGDLEMLQNLLPLQAKLPDNISRELSFKICNFRSNTKLSPPKVKIRLPSTTVDKTLGLADTSDPIVSITISNSCKTFSATGCEFPDEFPASVKDLKEIRFVGCELPDKFVIPDEDLPF